MINIANTNIYYILPSRANQMVMTNYDVLASSIAASSWVQFKDGLDGRVKVAEKCANL